MRTFKLILVAGIVCAVAGLSLAKTSNSINLSVTKWVTPNPPTHEELANHVCVVEFWATWCPPCRDQVPHMKALAKKYEDRNVIFVGLSEDRSADTVRGFVEKKGINYHIAMDNGLSSRLGVSGIPMAFVISHTGKILWSGHPADDGIESAIESAVKAAPKAMLEGVDMGRYSNLRIKLCGGISFADAYTTLESGAKTCNCSEKACACKVMAAVNSRLQGKITAAEQMQDTDPQAALAMYKAIIDNFGAVTITKQVEPAYLKLKETSQIAAAPTPQMKAAK